MRPHRFLRGPLACLGLLLAASPGTSGTVHRIFEDFSTTTYRDGVNTTADWDTVSTSLHLPPFSVVIEATYDTPGNAYAAAAAGDQLFVADRANGLVILDTSDPASPTLVGSYNTPGLAGDVAVSGNHAYVADGGGGLQIVDITNPAAPVLAGSYATPSDARGVAVDGNRAYVATYTDGLLVLDVSNPAAPALLGAYDTPGLALEVAVDGDVVVVADYTGGVHILDVTSPAAPALLASFATASTAFAVAIHGDLVFVSEYGNLIEVLEITDPTAPDPLSSYALASHGNQLAAVGNRLYVAVYDAGLEIVDIADPFALTQVALVDTPGLARGVAVAGQRAFVADDTAGAQFLPIALYPLLNPVSSVSLSGSPRDLDVNGTHAFVACADSGLQVFMIGAPLNPWPVGEVLTPGTAEDVAVAGDRAFVADGASGLTVVDITDPTVPWIITIHGLSGTATHVAVAGDLAVVTADGVGLVVVDVTDPSAPTTLGTYVDPSMAASDLVVSGRFAYVMDTSLRIFDLGNPAAPAQVAAWSAPFGSGYESIALEGDCAAIGMSNFVHLLDITDPVSPVQLTGYSAGSTTGIDITGDLLFTGSASIIRGMTFSDSTFTYDDFSTDAADRLRIVGQYVIAIDVAARRLVVFVGQQNRVWQWSNVGRSLDLIPGASPAVAARLNATTTAGSTVWGLDLLAPSLFYTVTPGGWYLLSSPRTDLRWSAHLTFEGGTAPDPVVDDVTVDWLFQGAAIDSIRDVPGDQGGWVRAFVTRSGYDFSNSSPAIATYALWRRVDGLAAASGRGEAPGPEIPLRPGAEGPAESGSDAPIIIPGLPAPMGGAVRTFARDGRLFAEAEPSGDSAFSGTFPPGIWEIVGSAPAVQQEAYVFLAPTVVDSSSTGPAYSVYFVTAHTNTPSLWFASEVDSAYSVDNLAPAMPQAFAVHYHTGNGNLLEWGANAEGDLAGYRIYRSDVPVFPPSPATLVGSTTATTWQDPAFDGGEVYYLLTAADRAGNESSPASPGTVTAVGAGPAPADFALHTPRPNPASSWAEVRYDVPEGGGWISLRVFDVTGRLVATLVDGRESPGRNSVRWDGRDEAGQATGPGVYFVRMDAPGFTRTLKAVRLR